ncbi:MAG: helix-turn-helix domain-containing protein [Chamaesiphon sp.]|nr:helix-turn-helix domain-containing protein [Chamaesiphon sp.]
MQQQKNSNLQYSPELLLEGDRQIVQIEDTSAFSRNKQRQQIEAKQLEMRSILASVIGDHQIGSRLRQGVYTKDLGSGSLSEIDRVSTGNIDLVKIRWHGAFCLEQNPSTTHHLIYLVLAGSLSQKIGDPSIQSSSSVTAELAVDNQTRDLKHQIWRCTPEIATTIDLSQKLVSSCSEQGEILLISIDRDSIDLALNKLIDRTSNQPVKFLPSIDLTNEFGLSLKNFAQFLWQAATKQENGDKTDRTSSQVGFAPLVLRKLEQAFLAFLIEGLPSNYSEEILDQIDGVFARHVHKARTFIESRLHEDIKLGDIVTATGVCPQLLQKAFSYHCGCSPMRFVTLARLHQVRQELTQATTNSKIMDELMLYQFTQAGKFAKEYHQLFGEKLLETLKKSSQ